MAGVISITFRKQISSDMPQYIQELSKLFKDLGIYAINISQPLRTSIEALLNRDIEWVKLMHKKQMEFQKYVKEHLQQLADFLVRWKAEEMRAAGSNGVMMKDLENILIRIREAFLAIMIWRKPRALDSMDASSQIYSTTISSNKTEVERFAKEVIQAGRGQNFEVLVLNGKRDYFRSRIWTLGRTEMTADEFFTSFNDDFHLFIKGSINPIYVNEIKKQLKIGINVTPQMLNQIYDYFFGSLTSFVKFLNRNYQYRLVEKGLNNALITYEALQRSQDTRMKNKRLVITHCPFPHLREKEFVLTPNGLENSSRFCSDRLIIFGKEANEEFTTDITLPNVGGIDSIFAFIFVNHFGYHLIDISKRASVKIKVSSADPSVLNKDNIVILAKLHAYLIEISDGVDFGGGQISSLIFKPAPGSKTTAGTQERRLTASDNKKFVIGRDATCDLVISHADISARHAEIWFELGRGWLIRDLESSNGTYIKLKNNSQQFALSPSDPFKLEGLTVFCVENFTFLVYDIDD